MSCEDIPSLLDIQNTKKHVDDFGRLMGTGEGTSTNGVTGQVRPTYNAVIKDLGFKPGSGDFVTGFTVMPNQRDIAWKNPSPPGDNNFYSWDGPIPPTGKFVPAGSTPETTGGVIAGAWRPRTDVILRDALAEPDGSDLIGYGDSTVGAALNDVQDQIDDVQDQIDDVTLTEIVQKKMCAPFLGFNNGTVNTEIFPNAGATSQGLAYANVGGVEKAYILQSVSGGSNLANERQRIVEYNFASDGSTVSHVSFSAELSIGHQHISALVDGSSVYLYGAMTTEVGHEGTDSGKGFSKTLWAGGATTQANVTNYQLWGYAGSGHRFAGYYSGWVAVSTDGKYLVLVGSDVTSGGEIEDSVNIMFVYDRLEVESAANPLDVNPVYCAQLIPPNTVNSQPNQGVACDGKYVYVFRGYYSPLQQHIIQKYDFTGSIVKEIAVDSGRAQYGIDAILNHPTLGTPVSFEPEGIALRHVGDDLDILTLTMDHWRAGAQVVSYSGRNWASIQPNNLGFSPDNEKYWVRTTKPVTDGAWDPLVTYGYGTNFTHKDKLIYATRAPRGEVGEEGIAAGITSKQSGASVNSRSNAVDVSYRYGDAFQVSAYSENTEQFYDAYRYLQGFVFSLHDQRPGSDNSKYAYWSAQFTQGREFTELRAREAGLSSGAGITMFGIGDSNTPGQLQLHARNVATSTTWGMYLQTDGALRPNTPDVQDLGTQTAFKFRRMHSIGTVLGPAGTTAQQTAGAGSPEGVVTAPVGSTYWRTDGAAGSYLYRKNTGTGNTGWVAIL